MMTVQTEYLIDEKGHKKSVVMPVKKFQKIIDYIEDLEDALELKKAKLSAKAFINVDVLTKRLKTQQRIR